MNLTKFGSLNLDTLISRYDFFKHVFKSVKKRKSKNTQTDRWGPRSTGPTRQWNRGRGQRLTGDSSPSARSPVMRLPPSCSPRQPAPSGTPGWVGGSPEQAHRRAWRTVVVARWCASRLQPWQASGRMVLPLWWPSIALEQDLATVKQWGSLTVCMAA